MKKIIIGGIMGRYSEEYRKYYETISRESKAKYRPTVENNSLNYTKSSEGKSNNISLGKALINYSIFQGIISIILLVTIVAMKYSTNVTTKNSYEIFKKNINVKSSYSEMIKNIKGTTTDDIMNDIMKCFSWIKDKIDYEV